MLKILSSLSTFMHFITPAYFERHFLGGLLNLDLFIPTASSSMQPKRQSFKSLAPQSELPHKKKPRQHVQLIKRKQLLLRKGVECGGLASTVNVDWLLRWACPRNTGTEGVVLRTFHFCVYNRTGKRFALKLSWAVLCCVTGQWR